MKCNVRPYEGNEPYIFFSYCHEDARYDYPIIEQMASDGYRIWYDDGLHPGDDWPERIAEMLDGCAVCMAALSQKFSESHNCKNELTFAINNQKALLVIKLEDFPMSIGMRLQLANIQYIEKYQYTSEQIFFEKLYSTRLKKLEECKGRPDLSIVINRSQTAEVRQPVDIIESKPSVVDVPVQKSEPSVQEPETFVSDVPIPSDRGGQEQGSVRDSMDDHSSELSPIVIQCSSGSLFRGSYPVTSIGRDKNKCKICFPENHTIGRHHIDIIVHEKKYYVVDKKSANYTWVDGKRLEKGGRCEIGTCEEIKIANETLVVAFGESAKFLAEYKLLVGLQSEATKESRYLLNGTFVLGRGYAWSDGVLSKRHISRTHAILKITKKGCMLSDVSTYNQTWVNERRISAKEEYLLADKDVIRIGGQGGEYFTVHMKTLKEAEVR